MTDDLALPQWAQAAKPAAPALPKWAQAAKPAAPALPKWAQEKPKPSDPTGGLSETWARTKELGAAVRNDVQDELALGNDIIAAGKEKLAQPGVLPKITGAADIVRGGINKAASPLTAVWNALGMADPMMTGGEGLHVAGEALKAPEKPIAAPAIKSGEQVFTGPNHAAMREATGLKDPETGFVKSDGQFIGRKEAAAEAIQAGEAAPATTGKGLHSEDLPPEQKPARVKMMPGSKTPEGYKVDPFTGDYILASVDPYEVTPGKAPKTPVAGKIAGGEKAKFIGYNKDGNPVFETLLKNKDGTFRRAINTPNGTTTIETQFIEPANGAGYEGNNGIFDVVKKTTEDLPPEQQPSLVAPVGKDNAAPLPEWAQEFPADRAKTELKPVEQEKPFTAPEAANDAYTGATVLGKPAPKGLSAQAHMLSSASASTSDILKGTIADREAGAVSEAGVINSLRRVGRVVKAILAPQTLDANAAKAAGQVRKALGTATRAAERDKATITAFQEHIRSFDMQDKLDIIDFMQSEKQLTQLGLSLPPEDAPLIQAMRDIFQGWKRKLEAAPSTEQMRFQEEYFPQQWKDPEKAVEFAKTFGTKEGSGGFTKAKKIPTVADGIRAGLEPVTHDPIDATLRYVDNVSRFFAVNEVFDDAVASSHVVWRAAGQEPAGWVKVDGRLSNKYPGQNAYAPEGWAAVYNNFTSRQPAGAFGDLLSGVQKISNSVTAFKLGLSGFHAMNMVGESFVGGIANAVDELASGHPIRALKGMATAPAKWITNPRKGAQMLKTYLSDIGSPEMRKVVELATEANFRVAGKGRVADEYRFTSQGSLWESFRKGALKAEAAAAMRDIKGAPVAGTLKHLASTTARVLETVSDPLFKHYIPALKNGAYYDMLSTWLNAHPAATVEEQVAFARQAADIIDDRFGEMNQDNIFWQKWLKQVAQASMVSYSYEMGTFRSFAGAAEDLAKAPVRAVKGQPVWTPKMSYAFVALPVGVALMGATYQWLKTGKAPDKLMDLYYPQTGGKDAKSGLPERAVLPSYMSQVFNFAHDPRGELANKGNGAFELMRGAFSGTDWRGDPITLSTDSTGEALKKYMEFALKAWEPITFENRAKKGTALSGPERFTGIRSAPMFATDPKGYEAMEKGRADRADKLKKRHDETAKRVYGGTQ